MNSYQEIFKSVIYIIEIVLILLTLKASSLQLHKTVYDVNYLNSIEDSIFNYLLSSSCVIDRNSRNEYQKYIFNEDTLLFLSSQNPEYSQSTLSDQQSLQKPKFIGKLSDGCIPLAGDNSDDEFNYRLRITYYNEETKRYESFVFSNTNQPVNYNKHATGLLKTKTLNENGDEVTLYIPAIIDFGIQKKEVE